jgi:hypothetical protein
MMLFNILGSVSGLKGPSLETILEEEGQFEIQYRDWKKQYDDWREQNKSKFSKHLLDLASEIPLAIC